MATKRFKFANGDLNKWRQRAQITDRVTDLACSSLVARADRIGVTFEWFGRVRDDPTKRPQRVRLAMFSTVSDPNAPLDFKLSAGASPGLLSINLAALPATMTIAEARSVAATMTANARAGRNPRAAVKKPEVVTVAAALNRYEDGHQTHKRQGVEVMRHLRARMKPILDKPMVEVRRRDLNELLRPYADSGQWSRAHRLRTDMSGFFNWFERADIIDDFESPALRLQVPGNVPAPKRNHVPTIEDCRAIFAGADKLTVYGKQDVRRAVFVRLLLLTACRRDEIADLLWSEVSSDALTIPAERFKSGAKSGEGHSLPLTSAMEVELARLDRKGPRVFNNMGGFGRLKDRAIAASGVDGWVFHDLRRAFSTHLANAHENGRSLIEPHVIERALGHTVKGVAGIYNKALLEAQVKAALELWENMLGANVVPMARTA